MGWSQVESVVVILAVECRHKPFESVNQSGSGTVEHLTPVDEVDLFFSDRFET